MKKIGLTGSMGAGKSSVIHILKRQGVTVLDCDRINDELLLPGAKGYTQLLAAFGKRLLDPEQRIDRRQMSCWLFTDVQKKQQAEAILHPLIKAEIAARLQQHEAELLVVVEVPLLFEVRWEAAFDEVWVVACHEATLLERLQMGRGIAPAEAKRRLAYQMPQREKLQHADVVFWNDNDIQELEQQVKDRLQKEGWYGKTRPLSD